MNGRKTGSPLDDGLYRAILAVLAATVFGGAVLALAGEIYFDNTAMKHVGVGVVLTAGLVYFFFRLLGRRAARRRENSTSDGDRGDDGAAS